MKRLTTKELARETFSRVDWIKQYGEELQLEFWEEYQKQVEKEIRSLKRALKRRST